MKTAKTGESKISKTQVFSLAALFYVAKKVNDIINKEADIDENKQDTIVFNALVSGLKK